MKTHQQESLPPRIDRPISPRMRISFRWPWILITIFLISVVFGAVFLHSLGFKKNNQSQAAVKQSPVLTVKVEPVALKPISRQVRVNGSITAWDPISIASQTNGLAITSIMIEEGASVKKGQLLATLDASLVKPQLEAARAQLQANLANAKKSLQPNRPEDINGLNAAVSQAQANVEDQESALVQAEANLFDAEQNLKRYKYLHKEGAISAQELGARETAAKVALAGVSSARKKIKAARFSLKQAQERLKLAKNGGRAEDIQIADATVSQTRAEINRLQAQVEQTFIRAPVDGFIIKRHAHVGDIAQTGQLMFSMARDNRLELRALVPETDLKVLKSGQAVSINSALTGSKAINGRVREISPEIDSTTRLATVRIDIPTDSAAKPGMYAEGRIQIEKTDAMTVPLQAVKTNGETSIVFLLKKNIVKSREVSLGTRTNELVEVTAGLNIGDSIVVNGAGFLKDGDYVSIAD